MRDRLIRFGRHLGIIVVGVIGVAWLLVWLVDLPDRWPDHGRTELAQTLTAEQMEQIDCLIKDIESDPSSFGTSADFQVALDDQLVIQGLFRTASIESQTGTQLNMRAEFNRKTDAQTSCSLSELLP